MSAPGYARSPDFLHSRTNWMRMAKHPRPPPSRTPVVAPRNVAMPTGSTSCHGMMCRKKSGVILPAPYPNNPPMSIPAREQPVTARNVCFQVIACEPSRTLGFNGRAVKPVERRGRFGTARFPLLHPHPPSTGMGRKSQRAQPPFAACFDQPSLRVMVRTNTGWPGRLSTGSGQK